MTDSARDSGFTLLEVLVALVIVALGLMAAFGQVNQSLTVASRLRDKTLAHWIATNEMTKLRLLAEFPAIGSRSDEVEMARTEWRYTIKVVKTPVEALRRVDISVALAERPDTVVTTLTGFLGRPPPAAQGAGGQGDQADWYCPEPTGS
ncbi:MAG: type II secretion system minor pseudopilin GspI [Gammaproteobacteria bacterium]|nr:type II secretion system minor pseudopilin GspI [Gammaproteobacteria bacterium]